MAHLMLCFNVQWDSIPYLLDCKPPLITSRTTWC